VAGKGQQPDMSLLNRNRMRLTVGLFQLQTFSFRVTQRLNMFCFEWSSSCQGSILFFVSVMVSSSTHMMLQWAHLPAAVLQTWQKHLLCLLVIVCKNYLEKTEQELIVPPQIQSQWRDKNVMLAVAHTCRVAWIAGLRLLHFTPHTICTVINGLQQSNSITIGPDTDLK